MQFKTLAVCAAIALATGPVVADELSTMTSDINKAASAMGDPSDAVATALTSAYPGIDVSPYVDCVSQNVTSDDLASLNNPVLGNDPGSAAFATELLARPETATCISGAGLTALPK